MVGIEPAKNLKKYNIKKNIDININYFSYNFSKKMKEKYKNFKVITANNVCAHTPYLLIFLKELKIFSLKKEFLYSKFHICEM